MRQLENVQDWGHHWRSPLGAIEISCAETPAGHRLRFPDLAEFEVLGRGEEILCRPSAGTDPATLRHLLLDQVLPRALSLDGALALHAGGVATAGAALAFLGASGAGKSTLCAAFAAQGGAILSDDCLILDPSAAGRVAVRAAYPGLRLWDDSIALLGAQASTDAPRVARYTDKRRVSDTTGFRFVPGPVPLAALFVLEAPAGERRTGALEIERLGERDALLAMLRGVFQLHLADPTVARSIFERLVLVCRATPVHRVRRPADRARVPELVDAISRAAGRPARSARGSGRDSAPRVEP